MRFSLKRKDPVAPVSDPVPADAPQVNGADIGALYYGERQAGDFYDFFRVSPERILFGLFDAAGRLEQARCVLCAAQETFRSQGAELFEKPEINEAEAMTTLCLELNRSIIKAADGVHSCPAFVGCYNEQVGILCYANAGHIPGLVRDGSGVSELPATSFPLGLFSHSTCDAPMAVVQPAGAFLAVSRGIVEATRKREEFGLGRVKSQLLQDSSAKAKELCAAVLDQVRQFMGTAPTHDDVTALALVRDSVQ